MGPWYNDHGIPYMPLGHVGKGLDCRSFSTSWLTMQKKSKHIRNPMIIVPRFIVVEKFNFLHQFFLFREKDVFEGFAAFKWKFCVIIILTSPIHGLVKNKISQALLKLIIFF